MSSIDGQAQVLDVDNVIVCAGQEPNRELHDALVARGVDVRLVGGADVAAELDAKRAIDKAHPPGGGAVGPVLCSLATFVCVVCFVYFVGSMGRRFIGDSFTASPLRWLIAD